MGGKGKGGKDAGKGKGGKGQSKGKGQNFQTGFQNFNAQGAKKRNDRPARNPVGELIPSENSNAEKIGTDFDFEESNKKMSKEGEKVEVGYNKSKGFFDTISSDAARKKVTEPRDPEAFKAE